jgi:hypothetical protein
VWGGTNFNPSQNKLVVTIHHRIHKKTTIIYNAMQIGIYPNNIKILQQHIKE